MKDEFVDVRILDNFYQTSSFFPMPVVLVSTVAETGRTSLGPYSLCFPYIVAGEHSMLLISREDSNPESLSPYIGPHILDEVEYVSIGA